MNKEHLFHFIDEHLDLCAGACYKTKAAELYKAGFPEDSFEFNSLIDQVRAQGEHHMALLGTPCEACPIITEEGEVVDGDSPEPDPDDECSDPETADACEQDNLDAWLLEKRKKEREKDNEGWKGDGDYNLTDFEEPYDD